MTWSEVGAAPWIGGIFLGWLACWLTDKWFVRDGAVAELRWESQIAEAKAQIARLQSELQQRSTAPAVAHPLAGLAGLGDPEVDDLDLNNPADVLRDLRDAVDDLREELQTMRQDMRYQDTGTNAIRAQLERLAELLESPRAGGPR